MHPLITETVLNQIAEERIAHASARRLLPRRRRRILRRERRAGARVAVPASP